MDKKLILGILGVLLIAIMIPWKKSGDDESPCQGQVDSLTRAIVLMHEEQMGNEQKLALYADSLEHITKIMDQKNENYLNLKKQNEKLRKDLNASISRFSNDDILRYLSKRYGEGNSRP